MDEIILPGKAYTFINAWKRWDEASARISRLAEIEWKNSRRVWPNLNTLKNETDEMVDAMVVLCDELGVSHVYFGRCIQELHRDGVDHEKCVKLVIGYLETML